MRHKCGCQGAEEYCDFATPYTAIATMIFVQAAADLSYLGDKAYAKREGVWIDKYEIINFFKSKWARKLAEGIGVSEVEIEAFTEAVT